MCNSGSAEILASTFGKDATANYNPAVPTPEKILGFALGSRPARHDEMLHYFEVLASTSPFVKLVDYGRTHEGRRLCHLTVSSEEHIRQLDGITADLAKLGDPRRLDENEADRLSQKLPATCWLGHGIHGDELSGGDAALAIAYRLAAGYDSETAALRDHLIVHIDPAANPDGRERWLAAAQAYANAVPHEDPADISHALIWPWGRTNHYMIDLNRDVLALTQPENRARVQAMLKLLPQLVVDVHEMDGDDTYLFAPPADPINPNISQHVRDWWLIFAAEQTAAFDRRGVSSYTRSWNEVFYPGYADIWPAYGGAVPIIYEQSTTAGVPIRKSNGQVMTYGQALVNQAVSAFANLATAARNRQALLGRWAEARRDAVQSAGHGPYRAYAIAAELTGKAQRLVDILEMHGIEVLHIDKPLSLKDAYDGWQGEVQHIDLAPGSWLVDLAQPLAPLIRNILDCHTPVPPDFLYEDRQRLERGEASGLMDITAWSLPLAFNIDVYGLAKMPDIRGGKAVEANKATGAGQADYGYLFAAHDQKLAALLLANDVKIRLATSGFTRNARHWAAGAFLVRKDDNEARALQTLLDLAEKIGAQVMAADGARVSEGPDLGDRDFRLLTPPRIAIVMGDGIEPTGYGALWHLFDRELEIAFTALDNLRLPHANLDRYNVLVFTESFEGGAFYHRRLGQDGVERLRRWVENGGTLITLGTASGFAADPTAGLSRVRMVSSLINECPPPVYGPDSTSWRQAGFSSAMGVRDARLAQADATAVLPALGAAAQAFSDQEGYVFPGFAPDLRSWAANAGWTGDAAEAVFAAADRRMLAFMPRGAYLKAEMNEGHWLAFGAGGRLPVLYHCEDALLAPNGVEVAGRFAAAADIHLSGVLWPEGAGRIAGTAYLTRERLGAGQVIIFANNPMFRGYSLATQRLLVNALLAGPGLVGYSKTGAQSLLLGPL